MGGWCIVGSSCLRAALFLPGLAEQAVRRQPIPQRSCSSGQAATPGGDARRHRSKGKAGERDARRAGTAVRAARSQRDSRGQRDAQQAHVLRGNEGSCQQWDAGAAAEGKGRHDRSLRRGGGGGGWAGGRAVRGSSCANPQGLCAGILAPPDLAARCTKLDSTRLHTACHAMASHPAQHGPAPPPHPPQPPHPFHSCSPAAGWPAGLDRCPTRHARALGSRPSLSA